MSLNPEALERAAMGVVSVEDADAWLASDGPPPAPPWPEDAVVERRLELALGARSPRDERLPAFEEIPLLRDVNSQPQQWIIDGLIPEASVVMLAGDAGAGKSTLATALAGHVASGTTFCGREVQARPVLILDRENGPQTIGDRMRRLGMSDGPRLRIWGGWLPREPPDPGSAHILNWVLETEPRPFIVVDSVVGFLQGSENDSIDVRRFMHGLRLIAQAGGTVVALHHSGKGESTTDFRGSSDFKASVDVAYNVSNLGDPGKLERVSLRAFKQRIQVEPLLTLEFDDEGVAEVARGAGLTYETLTAILRESPGLSQREFEQAAQSRGVSQRTFRRWLSAQVKTGAVEETRGPGKRLSYSLKGHQIDDGN
jgi:energy-coupling factor transporter ATP-binding protein EcfA2